MNTTLNGETRMERQMRNVELPKVRKMLFISIREISQQGKPHDLSWFAAELISHGVIHRVSYSCPETSDGSKWGYLFSPNMFLEWKLGLWKNQLKYVNGVINIKV